MRMRLLQLLSALAFVCLIAACAPGRMWMPQRPGDAIEPVRQPQAPSQEAHTAAAPVEEDTVQPPRDSASTPLEAPLATHKYTQATRHGDLWFLSGQIGEGGDIEEQTHAAMKKISAVLEQRGLNVANIVHVTVYLADINDLSRVEPVYASYFRSELPARAVVAVRDLPRGALIQISAIAGR